MLVGALGCNLAWGIIDAVFYLMASLPKVTWIRFGIWLAAGLAIYFAYSVRHSKLQQNA
jgi:hypothetical protein